MSFWQLLWFFFLLVLFIVGVFALCAVVAMATAGHRRTRYLAGGIDLVDEMTQQQFGQYLTNYFQHSGYAVTLISQDENFGTTLLLQSNNEKRYVFAKRSPRAIPESEVLQALNTAGGLGVKNILLVTNCVLFRNMDTQVKEQGVIVWDRETLIPLMGKAGARRFAVQAIGEQAI